MRKCLRITIIVVSLVFVTEAKAQYDVLFSHYFDMEPSFNPAAVGKEAKMNINAAYAMDMAGFTHNPQTAYIAADMPFVFMNGTNGVGLQFMNDKLGLFNHLRIEAQYAVKKKMFKGLLSVGVQAGLITETFDGSKLDVIDTGDPALSSSSIDGNGLDVSAGIYYTRKSFYVGLSAQHLTAPTITLGETNELKIGRSFYATAGYTFRMHNPLLSFKTSAIGRMEGNVWRADVTGRMYYTHDSKQFYGGLSYSPTNSVTLLLGMNIKGINVGYGYECYTNGISPGNGSHELFFGYQMDVNLFKKGKNLHKSVRLL